MENVTLANGIEMPVIGYGCYKVEDDGVSVFRQAIEAGFRATISCCDRDGQYNML